MFPKTLEHFSLLFSSHFKISSLYKIKLGILSFVNFLYKSGSISIACNFLTRFEILIVKAPFPGPISIRASLDCGLIILIILSITLLSIKKFCPHFFLIGIFIGILLLSKIKKLHCSFSCFFCY